MDNPSFWSDLQASYTQWSCSNVMFTCEYCKISFSTDEVLFKHVSVVHRVHTSKYKEDNPNHVYHVEEEKCKMCGTLAGNFKRHLDACHDELHLETYFVRFVFQHHSEVKEIDALSGCSIVL